MDRANRKLGLLGRASMAVLLAGAGAAFASNGNSPYSGNEARIIRQVRHEVLMYPHYNLFDTVSFRVVGGHVTLYGDVTQPFMKSDLGKIIRHVNGVTGVTNRIKVLPLSPNDNLLRRQVARAVFSTPALSRYAMGANPSIHIIVDNGHVTLTGVVGSQADKDLAGMRATGAGLSFGPVVNDLRVVHGSRAS